jgi:hypothetical protein
LNLINGHLMHVSLNKYSVIIVLILTIVCEVFYYPLCVEINSTLLNGTRVSYSPISSNFRNRNGYKPDSQLSSSCHH